MLLGANPTTTSQESLQAWLGNGEMVTAVGGDHVVKLPKPALRDPDFKLGLTQYSANE